MPRYSPSALVLLALASTAAAKRAGELANWSALVEACQASGNYTLSPSFDAGGCAKPIDFSGKQISISGNGAVLDAKGRCSFFTGNADSGNSPTSLELHDLTLKNGNSANGGAISVKSGAWLLIDACTIALNKAVNGGGGIFASDGAFIEIHDSTLDSNNAATSYGTGGAIYASSASIKIHTSVLHNNAGGNGGGAIYSQSGSLEIHKSVFVSNGAAYVESQGGAIFSSGTLSIRDSLLESNWATKFRGGAVFVYGRMHASNSTFKKNTALAGGAVYLYDGANATFTGCHFPGNDNTTGHNDITRHDNSSHVTFECANGTKGTAVTLGGAETEVKNPPSKALKCS